MWIEITQQDYKLAHKRYADAGNTLKPFSSFTDVEGVIPYGKGFPYMETTWGHADKELLKIESSKANRQQIGWDEKFYTKASV